MHKFDIPPLLTVSTHVVETSKSRDLLEDDLLKVERLKILINKLGKNPKIKKIVVQGCQTISFAMNVVYVLGNYDNVGLVHYIIGPMVRYAKASLILNKITFKCILH